MVAVKLVDARYEFVWIICMHLDEDLLDFLKSLNKDLDDGLHLEAENGD